MMGTPCIIVGMDGTLSDPSHRLHHIRDKPKNWKKFADGAKDDPPNRNVVRLIRELHHTNHIIICSGRHARYEYSTADWLVDHLIMQSAIYMRKDDDYRPDDVVKEELLIKILQDGWAPWLVIDDRQRVVDMWRRNGLTCLQCAPGDF